MKRKRSNNKKQEVIKRKGLKNQSKNPQGNQKGPKCPLRKCNIPAASEVSNENKKKENDGAGVL